MNEKYIMDTLNKHDERIRGIEINMAHFTGKVVAATATVQVIIGIIITIVLKYI